MRCWSGGGPCDAKAIALTSRGGRRYRRGGSYGWKLLVQWTVGNEAATRHGRSGVSAGGFCSPGRGRAALERSVRQTVDVSVPLLRERGNSVVASTLITEPWNRRA